MSRGIDYSKWDKIVDDSDEEDALVQPTVTKLDEPMSVTFGGAGDGSAGGTNMATTKRGKLHAPRKPPSEPLIYMPLSWTSG
jgi:hypothetical protein